MEPKRAAAAAGVLLAAALLVSGYAVYGIGASGALPGADAAGAARDDAAANGTDDLRFVEVAETVGLDYRAPDAYDPATDQTTNAGVYAVDYNNDGWTDVLAVGGPEPVLFENTGGAFERSGALPRIDREVQAALFFDYDNDGWTDLLLLSLGRAPLFLENRGGTFERADVGLDRRLAMPTGASAADYDGDGCLDLFIIQTGNWTKAPPDGLAGHSYGVTPGEDNGNPNYLYRGTCGGFERVEDAGIEGAHWSLAASFVDLTGDGRPDIHVANDFHRDTIYYNRGNGTFRRTTVGTLLKIDGTHVLGPDTNRNAMSSEVADVDGDGRPDLFVTNIFVALGGYMPSGSELDSVGNNLFLRTANGTFVERSASMGVSDGGWGWAATAGDVDNDGDGDLFHATMWVNLTPTRDLSRREIRQIYQRHPTYRYPAVFTWEGGSFENPAPRALGFRRSDGRGVVQFDFDRDGDLDLLVADASGRFKLYENRGGSGAAIQVVVRGTASVPATGARVFVTAGNDTQLGMANARADFLSQDARVLHFGLGDAGRADVRVVWPDGTTRTFEDVPAGARLIVSPAGIEDRVAFGADR